MANQISQTFDQQIMDQLICFVSPLIAAGKSAASCAVYTEDGLSGACDTTRSLGPRREQQREDILEDC